MTPARSATSCMVTMTPPSYPPRPPIPPGSQRNRAPTCGQGADGRGPFAILAANSLVPKGT
ncbi:hypothetical protein GCM10017667_04050 [Streptomyces filamentosus]|uniref:Uncharacterized protein n=1 Tax=Streptomyces filamentosus TaxID=67294 RepID=A0A919EHQ8_STRFL|nr:hypothetical protein GCM10017667_04050 [Streptomyces filamentosus]